MDRMVSWAALVKGLSVAKVAGKKRLPAKPWGHAPGDASIKLAANAPASNGYLRRLQCMIESLPIRYMGLCVSLKLLASGLR
jgi:hypothetical protein